MKYKTVQYVRQESVEQEIQIPFEPIYYHEYNRRRIVAVIPVLAEWKDMPDVISLNVIELHKDINMNQINQCMIHLNQIDNIMSDSKYSLKQDVLTTLKAIIYNEATKDEFDVLFNEIVNNLNRIKV